MHACVFELVLSTERTLLQVPVYLFVFRHTLMMFEHMNPDKKSKRTSTVTFGLPQYKYLAHFDLNEVIVAGTIPADLVSVPTARLNLCWGFYHMAAPDAEMGKPGRKGWVGRRRLASVTKGDKNDKRQALRVVLPAADTRNYDTRLYAFEMDHDAAKNECLRAVQEALLNPDGEGTGMGARPPDPPSFEMAYSNAEQVF
jgi:hypothetical protein